MSKSPRKKPAAAPDLKALVRRLASLDTPARPSTAIAAPHTDAMMLQHLGDAPNVGALRLVELKLTAKEEKILARAVNVADISIKPSGQPYLSHIVYTRWLNEAFGRTGWQLVPTTMPAGKPDGRRVQVMTHYVLMVHDRPVSQAWGEHEYWANNSDQSHGDAAEATIGSGLRRCCKHLGIGLEMWDRQWLNRFIAAECLRVAVMKWDKNRGAKVRVFQWRRRTDARLPNEMTGKPEADDFEADEETQRGAMPEYDDDKPRSSGTPAARPTVYPPSSRVITQPQVGRLQGILRRSGRDEQVFRDWLERRYKLTSTKDIRMDDYDAICDAIASRRALPE